METWGIFNFETFEWRCSAAPPQSSIRFGCSSVWLPPYTPFLPNFEVSSVQLARAQLTVKEKRSMFNTNLPSQYFWLLQQGRRPMDNVHTILLLGGYDKKGFISNQIDQVTVLLPPSLEIVSFVKYNIIISVYFLCCEFCEYYLRMLWICHFRPILYPIRSHFRNQLIENLKEICELCNEFQ